MSKKHLTSCGDCRYQMSGFDGGFFGLPVTCECRIFGETENRKNCRKFEKKITREYLFEKIYQLEKENERLKKEKEELEISIQLFEDDVKRLTEEISYWKHRVSSLLFILSQFDNEKVKKLLEELDDD